MFARPVKKHGLIVLLTLLAALPGQAGNGTDSIRVKKNSIRAELFGAAKYYSINFERFVHQTPRWTFASRLGLAYVVELPSELNEWNRGNDYIVTTCHSFLFGKKRSRFETGLALTFYRSDYNVVDADYEPMSSSTSLMVAPLLGYRYFAKYNINFGITAYPFRVYSWYSNGFMIPDWLLTGGISIGVGF
jgi:hypothetical protein